MILIGGCLLALSAQAYDVVEERAFTKSILHMPEHCKTADFARICSGFSSYLVSRFERDMVQRLYEELPDDTPLAMPAEDELDIQEVSFDIKVLSGLNLASCTAQIKQTINSTAYSFIETFNFNLETKRSVTFKELFEDPDLAAMLCARAIEKQYQQYGRKTLQTVVTLTEVSPTNFLLKPDGLEFIFDPGLVKPGKSAEHFTISLQDLAQAFPDSHWFPNFTNPVQKKEPLPARINPELPLSIQKLKREGGPARPELKTREQLQEFEDKLEQRRREGELHKNPQPHPEDKTEG